jgi:hypothetical protein
MLILKWILWTQYRMANTAPQSVTLLIKLISFVAEGNTHLYKLFPIYFSGELR